ncbi:MAG TPA: YchJ family protein [Micromonospora sp.]
MAKRSVRRPAGRQPTRCPCGSAQAYDDCCGRLHRGLTVAGTAEQLMRSRYAAFAVADTGHLLRTWHPSTRPAQLTLDVGQDWTGLEILGTERGGLFDSTGTVEFRARYRHQGRPGTLHERSTFVRLDGHWVYLDGELPDD